MKSPDNSAAIKERKAARVQSQKQFEVQMRMMKAQAEAAASIKTPTFRPASPLAQASPDVLEAGLEAKRRQKRRFGVQRTVMRGTAKLGSSPALGGATQAA